VLSLLAGSHPLYPQELEPRSLSNIPMGTNFIGAAYGWSSGNVLMDPALPVEDLDATIHGLGIAYVRAVNIFGMTGKMEAVLPYVWGSWKGRFEGRDSSRVIDGFGDPKLRFHLNFLGSPALSPSSFADYQQETIAGLSIQVSVPLGQYDPAKLINLGSNRWAFRLSLGVSHRMGRWIAESYGALWLYGKNSDFVGGNTLEQLPLLGWSVHLGYLLSTRVWVSADIGYGFGGRTVVAGEHKQTRISAARYGLTAAYAIADRHAVKVSIASATRFERGPDFDAAAVAYQFRWNDH